MPMSSFDSSISSASSYEYSAETVQTSSIESTAIVSSIDTSPLITSTTSPQYLSTETVQTSSIESTAIVSSIDTSPLITDSVSTNFLPSSATSITPPSATSTSVTSSLNTTISLIYKYTVNSPSALKLGNITDRTYLTSVQNMVITSFNLTAFTITVTRVEIQSTAIKSTAYRMIADILFQTSRNDCDTSCIKRSASSSIPSKNFVLPTENGSSVSVATSSNPALVETLDTTTTIATTSSDNNKQTGESPPGTVAKLGMGFGITIIGLLLIVEVIYFYRKYGWNKSMRETQYVLPTYRHKLSN